MNASRPRPIPIQAWVSTRAALAAALTLAPAAASAPASAAPPVIPAGIAFATVAAPDDNANAPMLDAAARAALVGQPVSLAIEAPASGVGLDDPRAVRQLALTAAYPDGSLRDLTRAAVWTSANPDVAVVSPKGRVRPAGTGLDGDATIVASIPELGLQASIVVRASGQAVHKPVSFHLDVIPALSQANCNMGACHGTPTGKGGFRLSLRGYLPDQDFDTLTREAGGRRLNTLDPDASMILRKPIGELPHEGGQRLQIGTKTHEYLRDWIAEGARNDPDAPKAVKLELLPGDRVLHAPAANQQIVALVTHSDGSVRDVTPLCYYDSSRPEIAEVDADAHVTFKSRGEVAIIAHFLDLVANVRLTHLVEVPGFTPAPEPGSDANVVDRAVIAKLNRMRIPPSEECTDQEFIRRLHLDVIGVLPTPDETRAFLADPSPDRRERLVDALLERPEWLDLWTLKFADILRANGRLIQAKGTHALNRWIRERLERGVPIDEMVRELIVAEGSSHLNPAANYYRVSRDPESSVETTAQLFLGVRIQCAKCHNHPFERWTQDDYYGFAAFFARVRQKPGAAPDDEVVFAAGDGEVRQPRTGAVMKPKALGGPVYDDDGDDRRVKLARWLTSPENPFFSRITVNRVWYHLMGRGIVEPVDDFRDSNPATNDELLDGLAAEFAASGFQLKPLIRTIVLSETYRRSARANELNRDDNLYFSHAVTKLLPAEVLLDAISTLADSHGAFPNLPPGSRAVQLPDGNFEDPFLKTFGRPARELACECERESDSNLSQALQLIGGATVNDKLRDDNGRMARLAASGKPPAEIVAELYMTALSREPNPVELEAAVKHLESAENLRAAVEDVGWVLINSKEFLFRH